MPMVRSTLRSRHITQNVAGSTDDFQNLLPFLIFAILCLTDLALELNPGSYYYEVSDAEVMVPFGSVAAEKWWSQDRKLAAMVGGNFSKTGHASRHSV